ncbi:endoplasmic reticulum-Golgi intermediate compartment protein 3-like [Diaphorina citri]|uniref:Endoplasmic reticulum-Golgi intermediate compartment protein 3 n=2 Tax=Diaphorina citri TaxID=121845 RepID=A0A3Q0IXX8_DIACI|nr:endoplasmic reticulum-Golgi intermediate compartment protein 3-like [Diaphorina citri]KAI5704141.1 hypothetical protein M8J75_002356 [Diaphorina citri]KAI5736255.1 hypothetical protein M8J76_001491 [Diaphorina citri]KAI5742118.1 hypothetical protein M8J77_003450 [Diaphorina citri]
MVFSERLKGLDAFTKPYEDFHEKTVYGGAVTIVCWLFISYLICVDVCDYFQVSTTEELFVDSSRGSKLPIHLDIVVPTISCDYLALDAVDSSGEQHLHVEHNIYKRRLDLDGKPIQEPQKEVVNAVKKKKVTTENGTTTTELEDPNKCGSCYGAETETRKCCNTCNEVKEAYRYKKWALPELDTIVQCKNEYSTEKLKNTFTEGCQIYGYLEVNRVSGSFHIAPGLSYSINHVHVHDIQPYTSAAFNTTHHIRHLSFGIKLQDDDERRKPLDGTVAKAEEGASMFNYYIKIIPTIYERLDGSKLFSNQFSVTKHSKTVGAFSGGGDGGMPGIFFSYELSPLMVKITEKSKSLGHLWTKIMCNISGTYITFMLVDALLHSCVKKISKVEIGGKTVTKR